ncbi:ABC transporter substrate-binding protein [Niveibacterium umoris]|uniref:ABC-type branched-subunit amino acid transport system substrate-binding protein n=1 Tax=Niveibacterium umoris TaxID=1193620 RepID=A0A840BCN8_9RHOO|nr:ABC transporter substrate-binding protein [Niveibacterium umoris]MBB4011291.1 ABC-type branched-subunit amino acid transport system substrate-binding protein [Niveibacterium umoris]
MSRRSIRVIAVTLGFLASAGVSAAEWVVAQVAGFTGPSAHIGLDLRAGATIAINGINARGGIAGRKIRLVSQDDANDPEKTAVMARSLLEKEHAIALFGTGNSDTTAAVIKAGLLDSSGVPLIGPRSGAANVLKPANANVFVTRATYVDELSALFRHCAGSGFQNIAVVYQQDGFGSDLLASAERLADAHKIRLVAKVPYAAKPAQRNQVTSTPDVRAAIDALVRVPHQAVLLATEFDVAASLISTYKGDANPGMLMTVSANDGESLAQRIGLARARGVWVTETVPAPRNQGVPLVRKFIGDLKAGGVAEADIEDMKLTAPMLEGYVAMQVIIEGLRRAGPTADPVKLARAVQGIRDLDLGGYRISFDGESRSGSRFVEVGVLDRNGDVIR